MSLPAKIKVGTNNNIPTRIKENLARRKTLLNLFDAEDRLEYNINGTIEARLRKKEARIYRLVD